MEQEYKSISFTVRVIFNQIRDVIGKSVPKSALGPKTQLQGGIMGYLFHHQEDAVYQKDVEREFRISRATATNTLQVMEKNGLIVRKSQDKDARLKRIVLTEGALANQMKVEQHMKILNSKLTEGLSEEEMAELYRMLGVIMQNLEGMKQNYAEVFGLQEEPNK